MPAGGVVERECGDGDEGKNEYRSGTVNSKSSVGLFFTIIRIFTKLGIIN